MRFVKASPLQPSSNLCLLFSYYRNTYLRDQPNVYWDGGPAKIEAFGEQHAPMCEDNWVCTRLGLRQIVVEGCDDTDTDSSTPTSSPKKSISKQSVKYLVNP